MEEVASFVPQVRFRFFGPHRRVSLFFRALLEQRIWIVQTVVESLNIVIASFERERVRRLRKLGRMPKMSTLAIAAIIQESVRRMPQDSCYLNIGVWYGYSLFVGMDGNPSKRCIGVDSFVQFNGPRSVFLRKFEKLRSAMHQFYEADWREYFKTHSGHIGVYFYDAAHDEESQYAALSAAHPFIIPNGIVIVDDWNWTGPRDGTERFLREHPEYETVFEQRTTCNAHPTFWNGIVVLCKCS